jgi:hypothetical protein
VSGSSHPDSGATASHTAAAAASSGYFIMALKGKGYNPDHSAVKYFIQQLAQVFFKIYILVNF